jgi:phosphatidylglycerol---prolipoprotein diacylglyceryl transferase
VYPILFRLPEWFPFLGGEPITSFGVLMFLAFLTGGFVLRSEFERAGLEKEKAWDMVFMAVLGGVLGAKIYYIFLNWPQLLEDPRALIFSRGGMVWYGGFAGAAIFCIWEVKRSKLPLAKVADLHAAPLAIAYAVGRVGCFLVGDDYGRPTDAWFGIKFPQGTPPTRVDVLQSHFGVTVDPALVAEYGQVVPVHPTQLYEIGMSLVIFLIIWRLRVQDRVPGWLWWVWLGFAGVERFLVEFVRVKDDRFFGPLTLAQVISLLLIGLAAWGIMQTRKREPATAV